MNKLPSQLTVQWHITDVCNLRCKHCYQYEYEDNGLSLAAQFQILDKLYIFAKLCNQITGLQKIHINFTGGEPFLRTDFLQLLTKVKEYKMFTFAILSNGYLLNESDLKKLQLLKPRFIQLSLEGGRKLNDSIRGNGSFEQVKTAMKTYKALGIGVMISFTANSMNYKAFPDVVRVARRYGAFKVWTDRYLPISKEDNLMLDTKQTKELFEIILKEQKKNRLFIFTKIQIAANRALQFLVLGGKPYQCAAGKSLIALLPNGDILPCRRLPIVLGNMNTDSLEQVFSEHKVIQSLTQTFSAVDCKPCFYYESCSGGLRCLSYSHLGNFERKDPNCWLAL